MQRLQNVPPAKRRSPVPVRRRTANLALTTSGRTLPRLYALACMRLDPVGPWAKHAKDQARKILNTEKLSIVSRRGRIVKAAG
jgi:hypothetical protein